MDSQVKIKSSSSTYIAGVNLDFLTDIDGNAWLTKSSVINILCKDGDYSFRQSFPNTFELKVIIKLPEEAKSKANLNGQLVEIYHESVLYKGMFLAHNLNGFNNEKVSEMVESIFSDVLPSIRKHGAYPPPSQTHTKENSLDSSLLLEQAKILHQTMKLAFENFNKISEHNSALIEHNKTLSIHDSKIKKHDEIIEKLSGKSDFISVRDYFSNHHVAEDDIFEKYVQGRALFLAAQSTGNVKHEFIEGKKVPKFPKWLIEQSIEEENSRLKGI